MKLTKIHKKTLILLMDFFFNDLCQTHGPQYHGKFNLVSVFNS